MLRNITKSCPPPASLIEKFFEFDVYKKYKNGYNSNMERHYYFCKKFDFTLAEVFNPADRSRKIAFTLAEVLITLGIIGVVAALTMPSLMSNHREKVFAVRAKKAYSTISQAVKLWEAQNESIGDVTPLFNPLNEEDKILRDFFQMFDGAKLCSGNNSGAGCITTDSYKTKFNKVIYDKKEDGSYIAGSSGIGKPYFITKDGTLIKVIRKGDRTNGSCSYNVQLNNVNTPDGRPELDASGNVQMYQGTYNHCAFIIFDTNGEKEPNQYGADIFELRVRPDGSFEGWSGTGWDSLRNIMISGKPTYTNYQIGSKFED